MPVAITESVEAVCQSGPSWFRCTWASMISNFAATTATLLSLLVDSRAGEPNALTDGKSISADTHLLDLPDFPGRPGIAVKVQHRGRLGVPGGNDGMSVEVPAARVGDVPAQHRVIRVAGVIVAGIDLQAVTIRVAQIHIEGVRYPVAAGTALDVTLLVQGPEDVARPQHLM